MRVQGVVPQQRSLPRPQGPRDASFAESPAGRERASESEREREVERGREGKRGGMRVRGREKEAE